MFHIKVLHFSISTMNCVRNRFGILKNLEATLEIFSNKKAILNINKQETKTEDNRYF